MPSPPVNSSFYTALPDFIKNSIRKRGREGMGGDGRGEGEEVKRGGMKLTSDDDFFQMFFERH